MENSDFLSVLEEEENFLQADYEAFKRAFERLTTINLNLYKEKQMKRRIKTLIQRKGYDGFDAYMVALEHNPSELKYFVDYITINVTEFFRTQDHWQVFEEEVLKKLVQQGQGRLRLWSCACASGEEPYSLAMSLLQLTSRENFQIIATDIDNTVLAKARRGIYDEKSVANLPLEIKARFFRESQGLWQVSEELKSCVDFRRLDLLRDVYPAYCDVIVCRNILIYFTEEAKDMIYESFKKSLKPGGYLFTGNTEQIIYHKSIGYKKVKSYIYQV